MEECNNYFISYCIYHNLYNIYNYIVKWKMDSKKTNEEIINIQEDIDVEEVEEPIKQCLD